MYLQHFGLDEAPFAITPDPRFVYLSERHRDALAHLMYGIGQGGSGGFVQLTGEVGTGKTTLCRLVLEQLPENVRVARNFKLGIGQIRTSVEILNALNVANPWDISYVSGPTFGQWGTIDSPRIARFNLSYTF